MTANAWTAVYTETAGARNRATCSRGGVQAPCAPLSRTNSCSERYTSSANPRGAPAVSKCARYPRTPRTNAASAATATTGHAQRRHHRLSLPICARRHTLHGSGSVRRAEADDEGACREWPERTAAAERGAADLHIQVRHPVLDRNPRP